MHDNNELDLDEITMREDEFDIDQDIEYSEEHRRSRDGSPERYSDVDNEGEDRRGDDQKNGGGGDDFGDDDYRQHHQHYHDYDNGNGDDQEDLDGDIDNHVDELVFGHDCDHVFEIDGDDDDDDDEDVINDQYSIGDDSRKYGEENEEDNGKVYSEDKNDSIVGNKQQLNAEVLIACTLTSSSSSLPAAGVPTSPCSSTKSIKIELDKASGFCSIQ
jgi:hypothetical protein